MLQGAGDVFFISINLTSLSKKIIIEKNNRQGLNRSLRSSTCMKKVIFKMEARKYLISHLTNHDSPRINERVQKSQNNKNNQ